MNIFQKSIGFLAILTAASCGDAKKETNTAASASTVVENIAKDPLSQSVARGKAVYSELCVTCHLNNGKGVAGAFPPLNPSDWLTEKRAESIHALKYGLKGPIKVNGQAYDNVMLAQGLDDQEIADVMNYTIQTWNKGKMVTLEEVKAVKK